MPGLIGTHGHSRFVFAVALYAEAFGLYALWVAARFNPMFVVHLFLLDLGAALLAHASARGKCIARNLRLVNDPVIPGGLEDRVIKAQVTTFSKFLTWLGRFLIIGLAVGKCTAMQSVRDCFADGSLPVFLAAIASYIVAALVHLCYTGDSLNEFLRKLLTFQEARRFGCAVRAGDHNAPGWPQTNVWKFESTLPIMTLHFTVPDPYTFPVTLTTFGVGGRHRLVHTGEVRTHDGNGKELVKHQYQLVTHSTLTDRDVLDLHMRIAGEHGAHAQNLLRKECVTMQFVVFLQLPDPILRPEPIYRPY